MKILVIDNYDSFTYNLVQLLGKFAEVVVIKNDEWNSEDVARLNPNGILISPGPGNPDNSRLSIDVIKNFYKRIPILGICLGHQCIAFAFGGKVLKHANPKHGKTTHINHDSSTIFENIPNNFEVMLYHSLIVDDASLPECLTISAKSDDGIIMGLRHKEYNVEGVQFHPESILTEYGEELIGNWFDGIKNRSEK